jgi:H2-forming N5,N10-methylenetetrahydromethanopterin dehydrogenase-like enzyme
MNYIKPEFFEVNSKHELDLYKFLAKILKVPFSMILAQISHLTLSTIAFLICF